MKSSTEYLELISAYADDELTESDRGRVEEHLSVNENCSALLGLFREISAASVESCVPAPDALCSGVMDEIRRAEAIVAAGTADVAGAADAPIVKIETARNAAGAADSANTANTDPGTARKTVGAGNEKKNNIVRLALTRYLPVAACLALVLIALPWVINTNDRSGGGQTNELYPVAMMDDAFGSSAPEAMPDAAWDAAWDAPAEAGGGTADSGMAGRADTAGEADMAGDYNLREYPTGESGSGGSVSGTPPAPSSAPPAEPQPEPGGADAGIEGEAQMGNSFTDAAEDDFEAPPLQSAEGGSFFPAPAAAPDILSEYSDAYAWIEIRGPLPDLLAGYTPVPLGGEYHFEMFFKIPSSVAQELIDEIRASQGIAILVSNRDSEYAIVLYSHEG